MTMPLLPNPGAGNDDQPQDDGEQAEQHRGHEAHHARHIASEEECLAALSRLPALVLLGLLTPAKANSLRSVYETILRQHHQRRGPNGSTTSISDELLDQLALHPEFANLLEPFLSDEQVAQIMAQATEGHHGVP